MTTRPTIVPLIAAALALAWGGEAGAAPNYRLKPGADGKVCLECHTELDKLLKQPFVHTPVKGRKCTECHLPHASSHGKLLEAKGGEVCNACHTVIPKAPRSTHKPVAEGKCQGCHDPHASANKAVLLKAGNDLCAGCHKKLVENAGVAKYKHSPVLQGCGTCHQPHASAASLSLLSSAQPALCLRCHKVDGPILMKKHQGYPVANSLCTSCHDPHGSNTRGMLLDTVHKPVERGMCSQCHEPPSPSMKSFQTRQTGTALCKGCHTDQVNVMLGKSRVHRPVLEGEGCLGCHSPHASKEPKLVKGPLKDVCGDCHADTIQRGARSVTPHVPVVDGKCAKCHDPHGSSTPLNLTRASLNDLCGGCHDYQKHSSHPVGEKFKDPRNGNLTVDCLSCHRAHGTEFKHLMPNATTTEMCTKCHATYRR